jgi:hypothetical protein
LSTSRHYVRVQVSSLLNMKVHYLLAIFDAAPTLAAPAPTLLYSKAKFLK